MSTVVILADKGNPAELTVTKQIKTVDAAGAEVWVDDKGASPVDLAKGEATVGDYANDHQRFVVELKPLLLDKPLPQGSIISRIFGTR